jgi:signal transduction histidine kinase
MNVKDSGAGFDTTLSQGGLGRVSMQERVRYLGGTVGIRSQLGAGTEVNVDLPIGQSA